MHFILAFTVQFYVRKKYPAWFLKSVFSSIVREKKRGIVCHTNGVATDTTTYSLLHFPAAWSLPFSSSLLSLTAP